MLPLLSPTDLVWRVNSHIHPKLNDIVLILLKDNMVAHRLVYLNHQRNYYLTKGDNNLHTDPPTTRSNILGIVTHIKRNGKIILLSHLYLTQSIAYISELSLLHRLFSKHRLPYLILKGLPVHLFITSLPPSRLYCDLDLLIKPKSLPLACKLLMRLGFQEKIEPRLTPLPPTQYTFFKQTPLSPIIIDLHTEPAVSFTRLPHLNQLLPSLPKITNLLWKNQVLFSQNQDQYPLLNHTTLLFFLFLHLYHHNFHGGHRLDLICELIKTQKINWKQLVKQINTTQTNNFVYPTLILLHKYYPTLPIPPNFLSSMSSTNILANSLASLLMFFIQPFNSLGKTRNRFLRLLLLTLLSPKPLHSKFFLLLKYPSST